MSKKNEPIKVYWSPTEVDGLRWSLLYEEPANILKEITPRKNLDVNYDSYLFCPSYKAIASNTFSLIAPMRSEFVYQENFPGEQPYLEFPGRGGLGGSIDRRPTLNGSPLINVAMNWFFFCEEPLEMEITPPYLHKTESSQYGAIVPGRVDIGQWFRSMNVEFQLWEDETELKIEAGQPIAYVRFLTDRPVELVRFTMTEKLEELAMACITMPSTFGLLKSLQERYDRFNKTKTGSLVMKNIQENLT